MKWKAIKVGICSNRQQLAAFEEAWKRAERGLPPKEPVDRLHFPDAATMFRALSRSRLQLLSVLRQRGTISVLALAKVLSRDYRNVYEDVKALKRFGLIHQVKGGVCVPLGLFVRSRHRWQIVLRLGSNSRCSSAVCWR